MILSIAVRRCLLAGLHRDLRVSRAGPGCGPSGGGPRRLCERGAPMTPRSPTRLSALIVTGTVSRSPPGTAVQGGPVERGEGSRQPLFATRCILPATGNRCAQSSRGPTIETRVGAWFLPSSARPWPRSRSSQLGAPRIQTRPRRTTLVTYSDRPLACVDCGVEFIHSAADQEYYQQKGFVSDPKRCSSCRASRRASRDSGYDVRDIGGPRGYERGDDRPNREYFAVVCSSCGNQAQVPFKPRMDRPVYCSDCCRTGKPAGGAGRAGTAGRGPTEAPATT